MRTWLYERLATTTALQSLWDCGEQELRTRIIPRRSVETVNIKTPYLVFGLGNITNERLAEAADHVAYRQFFQVWVYDEGPAYDMIDDTLPIIRGRLVNQIDPPSRVMGVNWLEDSQEFNNDTYAAIFRYLRFQAIIGKSGVPA